MNKVILLVGLALGAMFTTSCDKEDVDPVTISVDTTDTISDNNGKDDTDYNTGYIIMKYRPENAGITYKTTLVPLGEEISFELTPEDSLRYLEYKFPNLYKNVVINKYKGGLKDPFYYTLYADEWYTYIE